MFLGYFSLYAALQHIRSELRKIVERCSPYCEHWNPYEYAADKLRGLSIWWNIRQWSSIFHSNIFVFKAPFDFHTLRKLSNRSFGQRASNTIIVINQFISSNAINLQSCICFSNSEWSISVTRTPAVCCRTHRHWSIWLYSQRQQPENASNMRRLYNCIYRCNCGKLHVGDNSIFSVVQVNWLVDYMRSRRAFKRIFATQIIKKAHAKWLDYTIRTNFFVVFDARWQNLRRVCIRHCINHIWMWLLRPSNRWWLNWLPL